jgi:hypothetical protein
VDFVVKVLEALNIPSEVLLSSTDIFDHEILDISEFVPLSIAPFRLGDSRVDDFETLSGTLRVVQGRVDIVVFGTARSLRDRDRSLDFSCNS